MASCRKTLKGENKRYERCDEPETGPVLETRVGDLLAKGGFDREFSSSREAVLSGLCCPKLKAHGPCVDFYLVLFGCDRLVGLLVCFFVLVFLLGFVR